MVPPVPRITTFGSAFSARAKVTAKERARTAKMRRKVFMVRDGSVLVEDALQLVVVLRVGEGDLQENTRLLRTKIIAANRAVFQAGGTEENPSGSLAIAADDLHALRHGVLECAGHFRGCARGDNAGDTSGHERIHGSARTALVAVNDIHLR